MKTNTYLFKLTLGGDGATPEEAWNDATESFCQDPGDWASCKPVTECTLDGELDREQRLQQTLQECITDDGAYCMTHDGKPKDRIDLLRARLRFISTIACAAIAKATTPV